MNDLEQEEYVISATEGPAPQQDASSALADNPIVEEPPAVETEHRAHANGAPKPRRERARAKSGHSRRREHPKGPKPRIFRRMVAIGWSASREPVDDMFWAEAKIDGEWIVVETFERVRTRKEILERILALDHALVALDFNFSYPASFFEFLSTSEGIVDWRGLIKRAREELKKNTEDGLRLWVERLGKYRESNLDAARPRGKLQSTKRFDDWGWNFQQKGFPPHEQRSLAERFRRADHPLRKIAGDNTMSTMQIGYNRLTGRYEFNGNIRGRGTVLGLAMLDQLLEAGREDLAIWPMMRPKNLTIVESLPWLFTEGKRLEPNELEQMLASYEDAGWDIPAAARERAARNADAQRTLLTLLGMVKAERRVEHRRRPIRDYNDAIYTDPQIQLEGWIYGIGYHPREEYQQQGEQPSEAQGTLPEVSEATPVAEIEE